MLFRSKYRNGAIGVGGVEDLLRFCKEAGFTSSPLREEPPDVDNEFTGPSNVCQHTLDANETCGCRAGCDEKCVGQCDQSRDFVEPDHKRRTEGRKGRTACRGWRCADPKHNGGAK